MRLILCFLCFQRAVERVSVGYRAEVFFSFCLLLCRELTLLPRVSLSNTLLAFFLSSSIIRSSYCEFLYLMSSVFSVSYISFSFFILKVFVKRHRNKSLFIAGNFCLLLILYVNTKRLFLIKMILNMYIIYVTLEINYP